MERQRLSVQFPRIAIALVYYVCKSYVLTLAMEKLVYDYMASRNRREAVPPRKFSRVVSRTVGDGVSLVTGP